VTHTQQAETRDAGNGCAVRTVQIRREIEAGDMPDAGFYLWCGELRKDSHVYCFQAGYQLVADHMLNEGEVRAVPMDHPDLACWANERVIWDSWPEGNHPLRARPRWQLER
jgi:hypothetical protein